MDGLFKLFRYWIFKLFFNRDNQLFSNCKTLYFIHLFNQSIINIYTNEKRALPHKLDSQIYKHNYLI